MTRRKRGRRGVALLAAALALGCSEPEATAEPTIRPVRWAAVSYAGAGSSRSFTGTAETASALSLSFRSGGLVTARNVRVGQAVARGELLAQLDNVSARLNYEQAVASLNSAESQMNTARLALDRTETLFENGTAALSDYESARNSFLTAEASFQSAQRSVEIAEEQIRYGFIYAPESGVIARVDMELGENVAAGQVVAVLNAGNAMEISLGLPESVITRVREGMSVGVEISAIPGTPFTGRVTEVAPSADANTSTYPVRVVVENESDEIRSGMAARVIFEFGEEGVSSETLVVPASAVGQDGEGRFVFVVRGSPGEVGSVEKRHVAIGRMTREGFEILDGLSPGDKVATAGLQNLLDGQAVRLGAG